MIIDSKEDQVIGFASPELTLLISYASGIRIHRWNYPFSEKAIPLTFPIDLIIPSIEGTEIDFGESQLDAVETFRDGCSEYISVMRSCAAEGARLKLRVCLMRRAEEKPRLIVQLAVQWKDGIPKAMKARVPFLSELGRSSFFRYPQRLSGVEGYPEEMAWTFDETVPFAVFDPEDREGTGNSYALDFPAAFPWWHNSNHAIRAKANSSACLPEEIFIKPTAELNDLIDMRIYSSRDGWPGLFASWKDDIRSSYDLRRHESPSAEWARKTYLQHFAFAYGDEAFDYKEQRIRLKELLEEGKDFGGYDAIIYWHQYPRLGLDARTQWMLFDDLGEGVDQIREMAALCHAQGVRFLLPFKPWDIRPDESLDGNAAQIGRLVSECKVDGFFLDTMSAIPDSFLKLEKKYPELLFASEITPREPYAIEKLACSWDQGGREQGAVNANLFKFLFHDHPLHMVNRWSVGSEKDRLIRRAIFNGTGLVVWQDIFGCRLPFDGQQKEAIRRWKACLTSYHGYFFGDRSIPLYPAASDVLIINRFASSSESGCVYTIFNRSAVPFSGIALRLDPKSTTSAEQIISSDPGSAITVGDGGAVSIKLDSGHVLGIHIRDVEND